MSVSAHDHLAAVAMAQGLANIELMVIKATDPDLARRRLAAIALGIRRPIYAGRH